MTSFLAPRGDPHRQNNEASLATAQWLSNDEVIQVFGRDPKDPSTSPIIVGTTVDARRTQHVIEADDNRHVVTIAGSRAGKGVSQIIPNLLSYPGSVVCIDPKGENASVTARWRNKTLGQEIFVLDPFEVAKGVDEFRKSFNPLQWIDRDHPEAIDDIGSLADALIVKGNTKDPHWDESARSLIRGVMLFMMEWLEEPSMRSLPLMRNILMTGLASDDEQLGEASQELLFEMMAKSDGFGGAVSAVGNTLRNMGDNERGSILSTASRNTEFLESLPIQKWMGESSFDPKNVGSKPFTIYLVLPEWRFATHSRFLRLAVNSILGTLQRQTVPPASKPATLFILDEFATLGHMESIERAAGYIAGFGVKLWTILQDLNQLKDLYPGRWETFLGNAGTLTCFGIGDLTTLEYLSKRMGETEVTRTLQTVNYTSGSQTSRAGFGRIVDALTNRNPGAGIFASDSSSENEGYSVSAAPGVHRTALITPDEIGRHFAREAGNVLVHVVGAPPFVVDRITYYKQEPYKSRAAPNPYQPG